MTEARRQYNRVYYRRNKPKLAAVKAWRQKHDLDYRLRTILRTIQQRCEDPRHRSYRWYGGQGIKNFLTFEDIKVLWERDGAANMQKPSIDRLDVSDDYTFDNCRFVELRDNLALRRPWGSVTRRCPNCGAIGGAPITVEDRDDGAGYGPVMIEACTLCAPGRAAR